MSPLRWVKTGREGAPLVVFGLAFLLVGVGSGYFMVTQPQGLNPHWPLGMALLAPAVFTMGGLHLIATGLGQTRLSILMLRGIIFGLLAIVHWAAFFTTGFQCVGTLSFLGFAVFRWYPSEMECRISLRIIIAILDLLIVGVVGAFLWLRYRAPRKEPG